MSTAGETNPREIIAPADLAALERRRCQIAHNASGSDAAHGVHRTFIFLARGLLIPRIFQANYKATRLYRP